MKMIKKVLVLTLASQVTYATSTPSGDSSNTTASGPSVNQNANNSQSNNSSGQGMSIVMGGGLAVMAAQQYASQNYGTAAMLTGMSILSFIQSGEHGGAAGSAAGTAANTTAGVADTLKTTSAPNAFKNLNTSLDILKKGPNGIKADVKKGTINYNGKDYDASSFSSPSSMAAAGFNPDDIAKAMDIAAKLEKGVTGKMGAATATNGFSEGGGGGGGGVAYVDEAAGVGAGGGGVGAADLADRGPAQLAGMTKDFNGEPIGVAADSIFAMMNRRYILKEKQNAFINETDLLLRQK